MNNIKSIDWEITIKAPFNGLAPRYYRNAHSSYGNSNHFNKLQNIDLSDLNCIKQGAGLAQFTVVNSDNNNTYETLVNILDYEVTSNITYAISATYIWKITWADKTITMIHKLPTGATGDNLIIYGAYMFYIYNKSTSSEIGRWNLDDTWEDTWGTSQTAVPANVFIKCAHPMCISDDFLVIGNGQYLGLYDGTNLFMNESDYKKDSLITSIVTTEHQTYVSINRPTGAVVAIYSNSFDMLDASGNPSIFSAQDSKFIGGNINSMFVSDGIIYIFHIKSSNDAFSVSYLSGNKANNITSIKGIMPTFKQITWYKDFLTFLVDNDIYQVGQQDASLPIITNVTNSLTGSTTVANPFGVLLLANATGLYYEDGIAEGKATTLTFQCGQVNHEGVIDLMHVRTNKLPAGATAFINIESNQVSGEITTLNIPAISGEQTAFHEYPTVNLENLQEFNMELDLISGVEIREIYIKGHTNW